MRIGITERGDAGIDLSWVSKIDTVDGVILITKNITNEFASQVLTLHNKGYKLILHCTCTGFGGTEFEPNVPDYKTQLNALKLLIDNGFPAEQCVLRIDPIFPAKRGMRLLHEVMEYFNSLQTGVTRIRVSVVDEYKHVKERYKRHGIEPLYGARELPQNGSVTFTGRFQANDQELWDVIENLAMYPQTYEICAENRMYELAASKYAYLFEVAGCISTKDLTILGLPVSDMSINPQNRNGCHCLSCKTELLERKHPCKNGCLYCYWR